MRATVITYGSREYLTRIGLLPGELVYTEDLPRRITVAEIQQRVCEHFGVPLGAMTSARRCREEARPRQVAMALCKEFTPRSLPEIGRLFGNRDHTTVLHAIRQIEKLRKADTELDSSVRKLARDLAA